MARSSLLLTALVLALASAAQARTFKPVAIVNGSVISSTELEDTVAMQRQMILFKHRENPAMAESELSELKGTALDSLIDRQLILDDFKKLGGQIKPQMVDDDVNNFIRENFQGKREAFITELARNDMNIKKFRDMREKAMIVSVMRGRHGGQQTPPTPEEVKAFYAKNAAQWRGKDMIKISTITVPKFSTDPSASADKQKQLAEEIRSKIIAGADFASMAKSYSQDSRADSGGEWEWMDTKDLNPIMRGPALATNNGSVSSVVEDVANFIIIYVDSKKLGDMPPIDKVRADIEKMIRNERGKGDVEKYVEGLRKKAVIVRK
jgi:peptidyl-prolyl cis-trans isomerase SurA